MANEVVLPATGSGTNQPPIEAQDTSGTGVGPYRQTFVLTAIGLPSAPTVLSAGQQTEANSIPVVIASNQSAVPISAASLPLPANAAQETGGNLASILTKLNGSIAVTGLFWQTTQPVSVASLPLPTGAATAALQSTINSTLGSPFQAGGSIGNTSFGATQSGAWNITNITGTISLPTGAATQTTLAAVLTALETVAPTAALVPSVATASAIVTGGTALTIATGPINGGYVTNPANSARQAIATAEPLYIDPVASPGSTDAAANGTTTALDIGQTYTIPALASGHVLRANAATSGHKFTIVVW
jgi:hypothetical protein